MASDFEKAFPIVWRRENGGMNIATSNNPSDPGKYTRGGIALARHPEMTRAQLDGMTPPEFKAWYMANYWVPSHCDKLVWPLNLVVFDGEVNSGGEGVMALQAVLGVKCDGDNGPITQAAAAKRNALDLAIRTSIKRDEYYRTLKDFPVFGTGWLIRLFQNIYEAGATPSASQSS